MININELRQLAQAATPGPWVAKNVSGAGLEIHMSHPVYPDKEWPAFGTDSAFCKKGLVSYETWTQFPHEVRDVQQSKNAEYIAAANPATISALLDRLEAAEKERDALRAKIEAMERQKPIAWLYDDGRFVWRKTAPHEINYADCKMAFYALPGAKGE